MESLVIAQKSGTIIIEKHWKSQLNTPVLLSSFWLQRHEPIIRIHDVIMLSIETNGLLFIAITKNDTFPLGIFYQLELLLELFVDYFGSISDQVLKDNFSIIYELLEEWIDFGSPYITEKSMLKQLVPPPSLLSTVINAVSITNSPLPASLASPCPWRNLGITYTHNEIFFDIIEELDCIVDRHGTLLSGTIFGQIECLSRLSGMPELILILNKKPIMGFHQCVNLERYIQNDSISFVPPDGSFTLLDYTTDCVQQQLPLQLKLVFKKVVTGTSKLELSVITRLSKDKSFENLCISAHLPFVTSLNSNPTHGTVEFDMNSRNFKWTIGKSSSLIKPFVSMTLMEECECETMIEFLVDFRINMHSYTGLRIDGLDILKEPYTPFKGGRSFVRAGKCQIRMI